MKFLTAKNITMLQLLADGLSQRSTAAIMNIKYSTLKNELIIIHVKLGTRNTIHSIATAYGIGVIH